MDPTLNLRSESKRLKRITISANDALVQTTLKRSDREARSNANPASFPLQRDRKAQS
jgi:hypothetical protein